MGDNADEDADVTEVPVAVETEETLTTGMINQDLGAGRGQGQRDFQYNRG